MLALGSAFVDGFSLAGWLAWLAVLTAALFDAGRLRRAGSISVERTLPADVGLSQAFSRTLHVSAPGARHLDVEVREEFPAAFRVAARTERGNTLSVPAALDPSGGPDSATLGADGTFVFERGYRAERRGVEALGEVRLRVAGPLGLLQREARFPGRQELRVRPALLDLRRTLKLAESERWRDLGVQRLRKGGGQVEFESLRDYVHGDDRRHVDWKASARRGRPTVRQFDVERGQELWILIDCGRRMDARSSAAGREGWSKLDHGLDAALELAGVALNRGDRVGALAFDDGVRAFVPARRGRAQFARIEGALFALAARERESDLARALREVAVRSPRRALVLIVSEVADPLSCAEQCAALAGASRRHRLIFAALDDPDLDDDGVFEAPGLSALDRVALRAAACSARAERDGALAQLRASGARVLRAVPAESAGVMLAAWLDERRR